MEVVGAVAVVGAGVAAAAAVALSLLVLVSAAWEAVARRRLGGPLASRYQCVRRGRGPRAPWLTRRGSGLRGQPV
jgi:hypothetical protein